MVTPAWRTSLYSEAIESSPASYSYSQLPSGSWLRTNQPTADSAERRNSTAVTDGQRSGGATTAKVTRRINARVRMARHTRAAGVTMVRPLGYGGPGVRQAKAAPEAR